MQIDHITENNIKHVSGSELTNLHFRIHQLWSLAKLGHNYNIEMLKQKHQILVDEFRNRGFKHNKINDLDNTLIYEDFEFYICGKPDSKILTESSPTNVDTKLLVNEFYPHGLTEKMVYDYYMESKKELLNYLNGRSVSFFLNVDGEFVVKRNHKGKRIILNDANYEEIITGRTQCVFINRFSDKSNYIVVDIDRHKNTSFTKVIDALKIARNIIKNNFKKQLVKEEVLFTGTGIHYIITFGKTQNLNKLKDFVSKILNGEQDKYDVTNRRKEDAVNYDMSANFESSMHISRYSLTKNGLRVLPLTTNSLIISNYKI